jgi:predicted nucleic acid-binding protein
VEAEGVFKTYADVLTTSLPVTRATANVAMELRATVRPRLPLVDSLVAATAKEHNAVLVHRDPHMAAIPATVVRQLVLPPKTQPAKIRP